MVNFFFTKCMANDVFSEPPRRADSKNPIFIFSRFLGLGHLRGPGVSLGRILGVQSVEPFWGGPAGGLYRLPLPPQTKTRPPQRECSRAFDGLCSSKNLHAVTPSCPPAHRLTLWPDPPMVRPPKVHRKTSAPTQLKVWGTLTGWVVKRSGGGGCLDRGGGLGMTTMLPPPTCTRLLYTLYPQSFCERRLGPSFGSWQAFLPFL